MDQTELTAQRQEILNTVYDKLSKQRKRSINNDQCQYNGPDGIHCAVGHLVPESFKRSDIIQECEGQVVGGMLDIIMVETENVDDMVELRNWAIHMDPHRQLLADLQRLHDCTWQGILFETGQEYLVPLSHCWPEGYSNNDDWDQAAFNKAITMFCQLPQYSDLTVPELVD